MEDLPEDLIVHIFSFLENKDLPHIIATCKKWNEITEFEYFWKCAYHNFLKEQINMFERDMKEMNNKKLIKSCQNKISGLRKAYNVHFPQSEKEKPIYDNVRKRVERKSNAYYNIIYRHKIAVYGERIIRNIAIIVKQKSINDVTKFQEKWDKLRKLLNCLSIHDSYTIWKQKIENISIIDHLCLDIKKQIDILVSERRNLIANTSNNSENTTTITTTNIDDNLEGVNIDTENEPHESQDITLEKSNLTKSFNGDSYDKMIKQYIELLKTYLADFHENFNLNWNIKTIELIAKILYRASGPKFEELNFFIPYWTQLLEASFKKMVDYLKGDKSCKIDDPSRSNLLRFFIQNASIEVLCDLIDNTTILDPKYYTNFSSIEEIENLVGNVFDYSSQNTPFLILFSLRMRNSIHADFGSPDDDEEFSTFEYFVSRYKSKIKWPTNSTPTYQFGEYISIGGLASILINTTNHRIQFWMIKKYMELYFATPKLKEEYRYLFEEALLAICHHEKISFEIVKFLTEECSVNPTKIIFDTSALIELLKGHYMQSDEKRIMPILKYWFDECKFEEGEFDVNASGMSYQTPQSVLSVSVYYRSIPVIRYLIKKGAKPLVTHEWFVKLGYRGEIEDEDLVLELSEIALKYGIRTGYEDFIALCSQFPYFDKLKKLFLSYGIQLTT